MTQPTHRLTILADIPDSDLYSAWLKVSKGGL